MREEGWAPNCSKFGLADARWRLGGFFLLQGSLFGSFGFPSL